MTNSLDGGGKLCCVEGAKCDIEVDPAIMEEEIRIDGRDYRQLLELITIAMNVAPFHNHPERDHLRHALEGFCDRMLSESDRMGCGEYVEEDPESGGLRPTREFMDGLFIRECLDDMLEQVFWEDLVHVLSERDLKRSFGAAKWARLSEEQRTHHRQERERFYWREFEGHGIERLEVIPREPNG